MPSMIIIVTKNPKRQLKTYRRTERSLVLSLGAPRTGCTKDDEVQFLRRTKTSYPCIHKVIQTPWNDLKQTKKEWQNEPLQKNKVTHTYNRMKYYYDYYYYNVMNCTMSFMFNLCVNGTICPLTTAIAPSVATPSRLARSINVDPTASPYNWPAVATITREARIADAKHVTYPPRSSCCSRSCAATPRTVCCCRASARSRSCARRASGSTTGGFTATRGRGYELTVDRDDCPRRSLAPVVDVDDVAVFVLVATVAAVAVFIVVVWLLLLLPPSFFK